MPLVLQPSRRGQLNDLQERPFPPGALRSPAVRPGDRALMSWLAQGSLHWCSFGTQKTAPFVLDLAAVVGARQPLLLLSVLPSSAIGTKAGHKGLCRWDQIRSPSCGHLPPLEAPHWAGQGPEHPMPRREVQGGKSHSTPPLPSPQPSRDSQQLLIRECEKLTQNYHCAAPTLVPVL